jgi:hypothetical protein
LRLSTSESKWDLNNLGIFYPVNDYNNCNHVIPKLLGRLRIDANNRTQQEEETKMPNLV